MGKGFTLLELLAVVIILGILAGIVTPMFNESIRRTEFREVKSIAELTVTAARYYDLKYGINSLNVATSRPQANIWADLSIDYPQNTKCTYEVEDLAGSLGRGLEVSSTSGWLYRYDFEDDPTSSPNPGSINSSNSDKKYVEALELPGTT